MKREDLTVVDGAAAGAWIGPRLGGTFGAVTRQVPKGFEAYARLFHPPFDLRGNPTTWANVAKTCGTVAHREMQWHAIIGLHTPEELWGSYSPGDGSGVKWAGMDPPTGAMAIDQLDALCNILAAHSLDNTRCFFGLCTIRGWLDSLASEELPSLLELPLGRDYLVLEGPLSAVHQIAYDWSDSTRLELSRPPSDRSPVRNYSDALQREAPNLIWPADHSWLVASEIDFDSTLIGGSRRQIQSIIECIELEACEVAPDTSLADDADDVNRHSSTGLP